MRDQVIVRGVRAQDDRRLAAFPLITRDRAAVVRRHSAIEPRIIGEHAAQPDVISSPAEILSLAR
jgi:hypothetical protein